MPPFVVDFASASLDVSIEFSEEIWADWERTKQEQFGLQWETVSDWSDVRLAELTLAGSELDNKSVELDRLP